MQVRWSFQSVLITTGSVLRQVGWGTHGDGAVRAASWSLTLLSGAFVLRPGGGRNKLAGNCFVRLWRRISTSHSPGMRSYYSCRCGLDIAPSQVAIWITISSLSAAWVVVIFLLMVLRSIDLIAQNTCLYSIYSRYNKCTVTKFSLSCTKIFWHQ